AAPGAPGGVPSGPFPEVTIPPVDEAAEDPSFHAFHQDLLRIIEARDVDGLLAIVDPAVRNDFGGGGGIDDFRSRWGLEGEQAASSPVWPLLSDLLELGGVFTDGGQAFVAPYVFVLYDQYADELDPFYHSVVTGAGVNVRAAPSLDSAVLERVSHLVVRVLPADGERETTVTIDGRSYAWKKIQLPSGTIGYLADKYLWSPVGYRVRFDRHDDGWRLTFLLAGD
ncbi:MAG TPA: SH3 domain-containing protein, partial [Bacillota bacterium]